MTDYAMNYDAKPSDDTGDAAKLKAEWLSTKRAEHADAQARRQSLKRADSAMASCGAISSENAPPQASRRADPTDGYAASLELASLEVSWRQDDTNSSD